MDQFDPAAVASADGADGCIAVRQHLSDSPTSGAAQAKGPDLRLYQIEALARINAARAAGKRRILVTAPTGSGKTVEAVASIREAIDRGERVLVLVHRRELIKQTSKKLYDAGIDHGICAAGFPSRPGERAQIAAVQTLHARAVRSRSIELPEAQLIVVDECHHARARTWQAIIDAYPDATIIGLTATPCRADGRGLGKIFDVLIETATVADLTRDGYLVPTKTFAPTRPDLTGIQIKRGDYVESQLAERMNTAALTGDIVEHWLKLADHRSTVIFAVDVAHSVHLRDEFCRAGVLAEHIDGSTPIEERDAILAKLARGEIEIVTNCQVLTEGWDCPEVSCIVLARPTKSLGLYRQMVGRVLRPAIGKANAFILDHAGAVFQHGFVDDPIEWTLHEDRKAENKAHAARGQYNAPALTTCPECSAVRFQGQPCTACGWRPVTKPRRVDVADGDLGEVNRDRSVRGLPIDEFSFYCQLVSILEEKRQRNPAIKPGWVAHKFKDRVGRWPPYGWQGMPPQIPSPEVRAWVRSRDIAFAKSKGARR